MCKAKPQWARSCTYRKPQTQWHENSGSGDKSFPVPLSVTDIVTAVLCLDSNLCGWDSVCVCNLLRNGYGSVILVIPVCKISRVVWHSGPCAVIVHPVKLLVDQGSVCNLGLFYKNALALYWYSCRCYISEDRAVGIWIWPSTSLQCWGSPPFFL